MDALLWELLEKGNPDDWVEILIKSDDWEKLASYDLRRAVRIGNIKSCRIKRGDIVRVRNRQGVISMKADRDLFLEPPLDEQQSIHGENQFTQTAPRRPDVVQTGKRVAIGIADWGFDYSHQNFIDSEGNTRFLAIWDQGAPYDGTNIYGFGTVYSRDDINDALATDSPFESSGYHPGRNDLYQQGMHGTHVLDIAAGNGTIGDSGIAPEADLIAVHLATGEPRDLLGLGTSVRVFDAIHFINAMAGDQALVINMSVGSHTEAHLGKSLIEQAIDHLVTSTPGRCVVQSCGNYYTSRVHTEGQLEKGKRIFLEWLVSNEDQTSNMLEIWYHPEDEILVSLQQDEAAYRLSDMGMGMSKINNNEGAEIGRYYHRSKEPNTGLNQIVIILEANAGFGKWKVWLNPVNVSNGHFHSWIERDHGNVSNQSRFSLQQAVPSCTTGSICNGFHNICVGAINTHDNRNTVGFFSSSGPTADGRQKPDLVAPGVGILAAKSATMDQSRSQGELTFKTGTSMAAPVVTGAIALLYEAFGKITIDEVKSKLKAACIAPDTNDPIEKQRYGYGVLDIKKLLAGAGSSKPIIQRPAQIINIMNNSYDTAESIESLVEEAENKFPRLRDGDLCKFFDALPVQKILLDVLNRGDLLLRRQYGHHRRARWWIVDGVDDNELIVADRNGSKTISIQHPDRYLDREWKLIKTFVKRGSELFRSSWTVPGYEEDIFYGEDDPPKPVKVCTFFTPTDVQILETTVRDTIVKVAINEHYAWINQASDSLYREDNPKVFGKIIKYWIGADSNIPASLFALLNAATDTLSYGSLPDLALNEPASKVGPAKKLVKDRLLATLPAAKRASVESNIITAVDNAWLSANNELPWSAVFVSWAVRVAAVTLGLETDAVKDVLLIGNSGHRVYIIGAYERRFGPGKKSGCYHAFDLTRVPQEGDIIALDRQSQTVGGVLTFADIPTKLKDGWQLHCDIVVKVNKIAGNVETIGGNVGESVTYRRYPLKTDGTNTLDTSATNQFVQECPSNITLPMRHNNDKVVFPENDFNTKRVFALLSLEKECKDIPPPPPPKP